MKKYIEKSGSYNCIKRNNSSIKRIRSYIIKSENYNKKFGKSHIINLVSR